MNNELRRLGIIPVRRFLRSRADVRNAQREALHARCRAIAAGVDVEFAEGSYSVTLWLQESYVYAKSKPTEIEALIEALDCYAKGLTL